MYNTKFLLENGVEIYPGYLSPERRKKLKERFADTKHFMRCGCRPDANLYYRISENLRIYPEHNNYKHDISIGAIVMFKGKARKILVLFRTKKDERVAFDRTMYVPCVVDTNMPITEERLYNIIDRPSAEKMTSEDSGDEPEEYEEELDDYEEELEDAEE